MPRPMTYDHLKSKKKPRTTSVRIPFDTDVADAFAEAQQKYELAKFMVNSQPDNSKYHTELEIAEMTYNSARVAAEKASVLFKFRAIGRKKYEKLLLECPRTPKQKLKDEEDGIAGVIAWDHDKFPPLLVAASAIEPILTVEEVRDMWDSDEWAEVELATLFQAALDANTEKRVLELGKG